MHITPAVRRPPPNVADSRSTGPIRGQASATALAAPELLCTGASTREVFVPPFPPAPPHGTGRLAEVIRESGSKLACQLRAATHIGQKVRLCVFYLFNLVAEAWANAPSAVGAWLDAVERDAGRYTLEQAVAAMRKIDAADVRNHERISLGARGVAVRERLRLQGIDRASSLLTAIDGDLSASMVRRAEHLETLERCREDVSALGQCHLTRRLGLMDVRLRTVGAR